MNVMKQIADALGVELGEVFRLSRLTLNHDLYKITEKDFLKSDDLGKTWKSEHGIMFLAMCKGDWTVIHNDTLLPEHKELIEDYKVLTRLCGKLNRELITQRSLGKDSSDPHVKEMQLTLESVIVQKHNIFMRLEKEGLTIPDLE